MVETPWFGLVFQRWLDKIENKKSGDKCGIIGVFWCFKRIKQVKDGESEDQQDVAASLKNSLKLFSSFSIQFIFKLVFFGALFYLPYLPMIAPTYQNP